MTTGMSQSTYQRAERPTLHFIGVTTGQSSIMQVFPAWAKHFGLDDAQIRGIDFPIHADADAYRKAVAFIRDDPLSLGALVTTHKIDLYDACKDMFDEVDTFAALMGETSCLSKRGDKLVCHAKDPISSGLTIDGFLGNNYFKETGAEVLSMGAGGSTIALTWYLMRTERGIDVPSRIVVTDSNENRLSDIRNIHSKTESNVLLEYVLVKDTSDNDSLLKTLKPRSLVINATGLGKDAPGSPLGERAEFPSQAIVWDLNYRGELKFLEQARRQAKQHTSSQTNGLIIHDGWNYFIHGWTQVIAEVFDISVDTSAEHINTLSTIALTASQGQSTK